MFLVIQGSYTKRALLIHLQRLGPLLYVRSRVKGRRDHKRLLFQSIALRKVPALAADAQTVSMPSASSMKIGIPLVMRLFLLL